MLRRVPRIPARLQLELLLTRQQACADVLCQIGIRVERAQLLAREHLTLDERGCGELGVDLVEAYRHFEQTREKLDVRPLGVKRLAVARLQRRQYSREAQQFELGR
jgi:LDH2 family malate/lactate/ureidoglycolate dehydrogenase